MTSLDKRSAIPVYQQLAGLLRCQILNGELKPGEQLPSEISLSTKYSISRSSVRQAIEQLVRNGLVVRIRGKGNFVTDWRTQQKQGGIIALLVPDSRFFLFTNILRGVEAAAKLRDYLLVFTYLGEDSDEELRVYQHLREQNVSGFIIFPRNNETYDPAIWRLYQDSFPFVLIDRYFPDLPSAFVGVDNFGAAYRVVEYLISLGHRAIGFAGLADMVTTTIRDRYAGYHKALEDHGIQIDENWLFLSPSIYPSPLMTPEMQIVEIDHYRRMFRRKKLPTAIFAINDITAHLVFKAAQAEGIRIPEQLALVGFDDDEYARGLEVPLTTVAQPWFDIGARATHILIDWLRNQQVGAPLERALLPTHLVIRKSCGEALKANTRQMLAPLQP